MRFATERSDRVATTLGSVGLMLTLSIACGPSQKQVRHHSNEARPVEGEDRMVVRGAFDADDGTYASGTPTRVTPEEARKGYSPFAGRKFPTRPLFGDTHNHTMNSGDAMMAGDRLSPEQAHRFARGEEVAASTGVPVKLSRPLDFLVLADHAEGLGVIAQLYEGNPALTADPTLAGWNKAMKAGGEEAAKAQGEVTKAQAMGTLPAPVKAPKVVVPIMKSVWQQYTATARKFNEPGRVTAMIGFEWTSVPVDALIAATAHVHALTLVTRNEKVAGLGVATLNPAGRDHGI